MKKLFFVLVILTAGILKAEDYSSTKKGLALHYYGEPTFWFYGGGGLVPSLNLQLNPRQMKWPARNYDAMKGPVFHNAGGWSLVCRGALGVTSDGDYHFKAEGSNVLLRVNGVEVAADGTEALPLKQGGIPIILYWKTKRWDDIAKINVAWMKPGQTEYEDVPSAALSHGAADLSDGLAWRPEIAFEKTELHIYNQRELPFEIREDGLYELAAHMNSIPSIFQLWLDGEPLFYVQGDRAGMDRGVGGPEQRLDFLNRARAVRHLTPGKHVATVHCGAGSTDDMEMSLRNFLIGASRIKDNDVSGSLSIRVVDKDGKGRSDMVLRKDEPLVVRLAMNTIAEESVSIEVKEQRGDGKILWKGEAKLPAGKTPAEGELRYPCDREGAFEYVIRNSSGKTVDGPWAFVVVDSTPVLLPKTGEPPSELKGQLVDLVDCTLPNDIEHKFRDNGTSQVLDSPVGRYRVTGTSALERTSYICDGDYRFKKEKDSWRRTKKDEKGVGYNYTADWFAYTMKVKRPGTLHMLVAYVPNDVRRLVAVQAFDQVTGNYNGWVLDAGDAPEAKPFGKLAFLVCPNGEAIDVLTWCSNGNHGSKLNRQGAVARFELLELPDGLPAVAEPKSGWVSEREAGWSGEQTNLGPVERMMPSLWEGNDPIPGVLHKFVYSNGPYADWRALLTAWQRFGMLSSFRGDNLCIAPAYTYGMTMLQGVPHLPKLREVYSTGYRGRAVDPIERDIFKMMLLVAEKHGIRMVADLMVQRLNGGTLEGFAKASGCTNMDGILVTNPKGEVLRTQTGVMLNPAHPIARKYFLTIIGEIAAQYGAYPSFGGIRIRRWGWPSDTDCWYLKEQNGYDDFTVSLFEKETGLSVQVDDKSDARFQLRQKRLLGDMRKAWLDWRCQKVQSLIEEAVVVLCRHAPNARLYGQKLKTDEASALAGRGGGLDAARLAGRRDLGFEEQAGYGGDGVEWNAPDPIAFANFDIREPVALRRTLENMQPMGFCYPAGMTCNASFRTHPYQLEEPAKALAKSGFDTFVYGPAWCVPPIDEGFRSFIQVFRAIPNLPYVRFAGKGGEQPMVACWSAERRLGGFLFGSRETIFYLVNKMPQRQELSVVFPDSIRSVANLVNGNRISADHGVVQISLEPFMPAVFAADRAASVLELRVPISLVKMNALKQRFESMKTIREAAGTTRHAFKQTVSEEGGKAQYVSETFDDAWLPIEKAWMEGEFFKADNMTVRMLAERTWWFEAFGWPTGNTFKLSPSGGLFNPEKLAKNVKSEGESELAEIAPFKGKFLIVPSGKATCTVGVSADGIYELRIWGLFGGGYGPIKVMVDGKDAGRIGVDAKETGETHYVMPETVTLRHGGHHITLIAEGSKGLALSAFMPKLQE
ncbi:MAG: hypothetical protein WAX69_17275 [Victivallales bacterium]